MSDNSAVGLASFELVRKHAETWLGLDDEGRIVSDGPRFEIAGCQEGNLVLVNRSVPERLACEIFDLAATEPPLFAPGSVPLHDDKYKAILSRQAPVERSFAESLEYAFPEPFGYQHDVHVVRSGTAEGEELLASLPEQDPHGVWAHPIRGHIAEPWAIALHEGLPAAIVETVRLAGPGAECGVTTALGLRSRGFGAAATAEWARHPALQGRVRFYSTETANLASQRLTQRLGLLYLGASYRIP